MFLYFMTLSARQTLRQHGDKGGTMDVSDGSVGC
jgi:hypothetical protein